MSLASCIPVWRRASARRIFAVCWGAGVLAINAFAGSPASPRSEYFARTWTTDEGLPYNAVQEVVQDQTGYLWIATLAGLARFDGQRFTPFPLPAKYLKEGANIRGLAVEDAHTLVLLPTSGEVVRLRDGVFSRHPVSEHLPESRPLDLFTEPNGTLWLGCENGAILRWAQGECRQFGAADGLPGRRNRITFAHDADGNTWISSNGFFGRYAGGKLERTNVGGSQQVMVANDEAGHVWIASSAAVSQLESGKVRMMASAPPWKAGGLTGLQSFFFDREGNGWFACGMRGLYRLSDGIFSAVDVPYSIVNTVAQDREGNLWVASADRGLGQLQHRSYQLFDANAGLVEDISNAVWCDPRGDVWVANNRGGILRVLPDRIESLELKHGRNLLYGSTLCFDAPGNLWVATPSGLYRVAPPFTGTVERLPVPTRSVHLLFTAHDGAVWFAASPSTFGYYRDGEPHVFTAADGYDGQTIRTLAEDRQGVVWAGGFNGDLLRIERDRVTRLGASDGLNGQPIHHLLVDPELDALWIATAGGLLLRQEGKIHAFTPADGLADDLIGHVQADDYGYLWFSARGGLFNVRKAELLARARGDGPPVFSRRFGRERGLVGVSPRYNQHPSSGRSTDGRLWFATMQGLLAVTPEATPTEAAPPLLIDEVILNNEPVKPGARLQVPFGQHRLEFHFAVLTYRSPEDVRLRHKLEGADPDWIATGPGHTASYSGLAPGTYVLRVRADGGGASVANASVTFVVLPAWWQDPWVLAAGFIALAAITGLGVWYALRRQYAARVRRLEQAHALERERSRIARDLHDDLGGSLTEANFLIERLRNTPAAELPDGLASLASHVRHVGMDLASIVWAVSPKHNSLDQLSAFLRRYVQRFFGQTNIVVTVHEAGVIPPLPLAPEVQHSLLAIAKESLTNVLKHAHATRITLGLTCAHDVFELTVIDDGVGFDLDDPAHQEGNGLGNLRTRAEEIGAELSLESFPGRGTRLRLRYPCFPTVNLSSSRAPS